MLFSLYLLFFFPQRCCLVAFVVALALSVLSHTEVIAKLFDCVDYFAIVFLFFCSSSSSRLLSHSTSTYCKHTVVIVRQQHSSLPLTLLLFIDRSYFPAFGPCCSLSSLFFSFIILPLDHTNPLSPICKLIYIYIQIARIVPLITSERNFHASV